MTKHWDIIRIEGYCGLGWNNEVDEGLRPEYCPIDPPAYQCLSNDCPHFFYCSYRDDGDRLDKDQVLDFLELEMAFHHDEPDGEYAYQKWLIGNYLKGIIEYIRSGRFDA